jgi:transposase
VEPESEPANCRHCLSARFVSKGRYHRRVRHLDTFGRASRLFIKTRRYQCRDCSKSFLPDLPGVRAWRRSSEPWRQSIYRNHHEGICAKALARMHALGTATVERIYGEFTSRKARERISLQCPIVLGIDEHRVHRNQPFATTFCDLHKHRIFVSVTPGASMRRQSYLSYQMGYDEYDFAERNF